MQQDPQQSLREKVSQANQAEATCLRPREDLLQYFQQYARENPELIAIYSFGLGFILGWKLKPW